MDHVNGEQAEKLAQDQKNVRSIETMAIGWSAVHLAAYGIEKATENDVVEVFAGISGVMAGVYVAVSAVFRIKDYISSIRSTS